MFDGGDFVEVPSALLCMHSTTCRGADIAAKRLLEPVFAASGPGGSTARPHVIATPMKGIPIERRKFGNAVNFHTVLLYHQTARQANLGGKKSVAIAT